MSSRTNPGPTESSPTSPPLRAFAALAAGDIQTARSYLDTGLIRVSSMQDAGESWDPSELRAVKKAVRDMIFMLAELTGRSIVIHGEPLVSLCHSQAPGSPAPGLCVRQAGHTDSHMDRDRSEWANSANSSEAS